MTIACDPSLVNRPVKNNLDIYQIPKGFYGERIFPPANAAAVVAPPTVHGSQPINGCAGIPAQ
jgi:hypothetical protein